MNSIIGTVASSFAAVGSSGASPSKPGEAGTPTAGSSPLLPSGEAADQGKALDEALNVVKVQSHYMKKCLVGWKRAFTAAWDRALVAHIQRVPCSLGVLPTSCVSGPKQAYGRAETLFDNAC